MGKDPPAGGSTEAREPAAGRAHDSGNHRTVPRRHWAGWTLDPLILACAAVLVGFPFAATLAASGQPTVGREIPARPPTAERGPDLRDVPAFVPGGAAATSVARGAILTETPAMRRAVRAAMRKLFDRRDRAALEEVLSDAGAVTLRGPPSYPFRFPRIEAVLDEALPTPLGDSRTRAANDLGALLVLAAARDAGSTVPAHGYAATGTFAAAAPLGYAILDRARAGGDCLAQLNLAFLLSTHARPLVDVTAAELERAEQACPGDPTPLWLRGQFFSQVAGRPEQTGQAEFDEAVATFRRLQRGFPGSSAGWAGEADSRLRTAYRIVVGQPFTARDHFRRALALLGRARALDPDPGLAAGEARAYAGLRQYRDAVSVQRRAISAVEQAAPLEARLVVYLEQDRRFAAAAEAAAALAASPRFPDGSALFMSIEGDDPLTEEDAQGPLSLGSDRVRAVSLDVAPVPPLPFADGVLDLSFLPEYRDVEAVTGYEPWCPEWSRRRDLVLAGRPEEALAGLPQAFTDIRPGIEDPDCPQATQPSAELLAAVAELEAGDRDAAVRRLISARFDTAGRRPLVVLLDAQQNLWRFAGDLERAGAAAEEWTRRAPASGAAFDRAGEIAFLEADYERAARLFAVAARLVRSRAGTWTGEEAEALLKRGTVLALAARHEEALADLDEADEVASRAFAIAGRDAAEGVDLAAYVSYNARLQAGDTHLRARRYAAALEQYEAARERERDLPAVAPGEPLRRPEVLDNNEGVVLITLGRPADALAPLRRAIAADPLNPVFLQNLGAALRRLGRLDEAIAAYRSAVASEPSVFPAWNDLGVALAAQGRLADAAAAFRRTVGVRPDYALGWFNLGVVLGRMGIRHAAAAEGALARAFRADSNLRGRARDVAADEEPYFTTLDLSKPLPPKWEFARAQERTPVAAAGLALALLFGLQFGRKALAPGLGSGAKRWLELGRDAFVRLPRTLVSTNGGLAVGATLLIFLVPLLRSGDATFASALLLTVGVAALVAIVLRSRVLAARTAGVRLRQPGWSPGIAVGLGAAAAGLGWAPLPVAETDRPAPAVHWVGPVATGIAALCLLVLGVGLDVPTTRALGTIALVMTASLLTPLEPLDGGHVAKGPAGVAAGLALLAAAVFLLLGLS